MPKIRASRKILTQNAPMVVQDQNAPAHLHNIPEAFVRKCRHVVLIHVTKKTTTLNAQKLLAAATHAPAHQSSTRAKTARRVGTCFSMNMIDFGVVVEIKWPRRAGLYANSWFQFYRCDAGNTNNPCIKKDHAAVCNDIVKGGYKCKCSSPNFSGEYCENSRCVCFASGQVDCVETKSHMANVCRPLKSSIC